MISETVKGISDTITNESLINLDYADMMPVMNCAGVAVMLFGESKLTAPPPGNLKIQYGSPYLPIGPVA